MDTIIKLLRRGPVFRIPAPMAGEQAAAAAEVQYSTFVETYIVPLLSASFGGDAITATIGDGAAGVAVGKNVEVSADGKELKRMA